MKKILICDCRETDCSLLCAGLSKESGSYSVKLVFSPKDMKNTLTSFSPDVVLCGSDFCGIPIGELSGAFPSLKDAPVIYIHDLSRSIDTELSKVSDVICTPLRLQELILRIEMRTVRNASQNVFTNGALTIDHELCRVTVNGDEVHLTMFEYKLLCILARSCGWVVRYEDVLSELWDNPVGSEVGALRVYINAIRRKLGKTEDGESYVQTHMGMGYCMPVLN